MKAIVPTAGQGTRLYPQTHTKPKPMVRLAGKPILGHILSGLSETRIDEVVIVVGGSMQDLVTEYAKQSFGDIFSLSFVEQESAEGLGHSVYQAEEITRGDDLFILLGDMLFENSYNTFLESHDGLSAPDASIGVKTVDEPQHYGVAEVKNNTRVERLVEKPDNPRSNYAISGVYIVKNSELFFDELGYLIKNDIRGVGNEYQLTDALQRMIQQNAEIDIFDVEDWYDCGRPETLLEANRVLLSKIETTSSIAVTNGVIIPPVDLGNKVTIEDSVVGPYVSVDDGASISESIIRDGIVGRNATLQTVNLEKSIVGDGATIRDEPNHLNIGDNSVIEL